MSSNSKHPIFFDPGFTRWRRLRWIIFFTFAALAVIFGFTIFDISRWPEINAPKLASPAPLLEKAIAGDKLNSSLASAAAASVSPSNISPSNETGSGVKISPVIGGFMDFKSAALNKTRLIGFYVNWDDESFLSLKNNLDKIDELMPEWLHLEKNGAISIDDELRQKETVDYIAKFRSDLPVVPIINNFNSQNKSWDGQLVGDMLYNPKARINLINNLYDFVQKNKFSGINIDLENIPPASQPLLEAFMKELYAKFNPQGLEVSMDIPMADTDYDARILSKYCDFIVLMGYDENTPEGPAGPVASQQWFASNISWRMRQIPANKYVVALGNYGYDWQEQDSENETLTYRQAMRLAQRSQSADLLESATLNPFFYYSDENKKTHQVWFLDAATVFNQIAALKTQPPLGFALWRLGSEDPGVWQIFPKRENLDGNAAALLENINFPGVLDYEGSGEIMKVSQAPRAGVREITYNSRTGLIEKEKINVFPSVYTVHRWGGSDSKKIALTFDDGPDSRWTPEVLNILKKYGARATFFVVGTNAIRYPEIVKHAVNGGNSIGIHTFTHPDVSSISDEHFALEINSSQKLLEGMTKVKTFLFRPPYAEDIEPETPEQLRTLSYAGKLGYYTVGMHIDAHDWSNISPDEIVSRIISQTEEKQGNVILLHDAGGDRSRTLEALPRIIEALQSKGYELVTVPELLNISENQPAVDPHFSQIFAAFINDAAFKITGWTLRFIYILFLVGIILGIARLIFIGVIAVIERLSNHSKKYGRYLNSYQPTVSVIIPAYNEEKVIIKTIDSILKSNYPDLEIIAVSDGSTDGTYEMLLEKFSGNPKIKIFSKNNGGKSNALNWGIGKSAGEILITLDADTLFRRDTIGKLVRHFRDVKAGAVAGNTRVGNRVNILTRWQALEYITSQNLDRRAFDLLNCITVVPGSVGAWRRTAFLEAGGFSDNTLAEDADLTFSIVRNGYKVVYDDEAIAYTEAPDTVRNFVKQRFRWMYGTFQTVWKHRSVILNPRHKGLGLVAAPNILIFQILFPLLSPIVDLVLICSIGWALWQEHNHPLEFSSFYYIKNLLFFYLLFVVVDYLAAILAFMLERRHEDDKLLLWLFFQRFFYRQLMYYVAIKVFIKVLKGKAARWGTYGRKATVERKFVYLD